MTEQKERLKKLYALALRGVDGEKEQAQAILDKLLKKYAMTLDDLDDEVIQEYDLEYHGKEQDRILMQTAYKVTDDKNAFNHLQYNHSGRACRTRLRVRCTAAQKAEIEFLFNFYVRLWEKEKEALLQAFFQKHRIFGNLKDGESGAELSPEELLKLELMMKGLSDEQPLKQLTDGAGVCLIMPSVWCYNEECKYLKDNECMADMIELDEYGACGTFENYKDDKEYKAEYFIAVNTKDKRHGRAAKRGKKITINGIEFFTDSPPLEGENAIYITHARTGLACGTVELVKKHWEQFIKAQEKVADINTLPLAEYDEKTRKYLIKEVSQCANP